MFVPTYQVHEHDISCIAFSRDGTRLVSVGIDNDVYSLIMWELSETDTTQLCCVPLNNVDVV